MFYASLISLIVTAMIAIYLQSLFSKSENALFVLLGLPILAYVLSGTLSTTLAWIYYRIYVASGSDPIGAVF
jgi:inner membrane protein involved in colicin E2 resistance